MFYFSGAPTERAGTPSPDDDTPLYDYGQGFTEFHASHGTLHKSGKDNNITTQPPAEGSAQHDIVPPQSGASGHHAEAPGDTSSSKNESLTHLPKTNGTEPENTSNPGEGITGEIKPLGPPTPEEGSVDGGIVQPIGPPSKAGNPGPPDIRPPDDNGTPTIHPPSVGLLPGDGTTMDNTTQVNVIDAPTGTPPTSSVAPFSTVTEAQGPEPPVRPVSRNSQVDVTTIISTDNDVLDPDVTTSPQHPTSNTSKSTEAVVQAIDISTQPTTTSATPSSTTSQHEAVSVIHLSQTSSPSSSTLEQSETPSTQSTRQPSTQAIIEGTPSSMQSSTPASPGVRPIPDPPDIGNVTTLADFFFMEDTTPVDPPHTSSQDPTESTPPQTTSQTEEVVTEVLDSEDTTIVETTEIYSIEVDQITEIPSKSNMTSTSSKDESDILTHRIPKHTVSQEYSHQTRSSEIQPTVTHKPTSKDTSSMIKHDTTATSTYRPPSKETSFMPKHETTVSPTNRPPSKETSFMPKHDTTATPTHRPPSKETSFMPKHETTATPTHRPPSKETSFMLKHETTDSPTNRPPSKETSFMPKHETTATATNRPPSKETSFMPKHETTVSPTNMDTSFMPKHETNASPTNKESSFIQLHETTAYSINRPLSKEMSSLPKHETTISPNDKPLSKETSPMPKHVTNMKTELLTGELTEAPTVKPVVFSSMPNDDSDFISEVVTEVVTEELDITDTSKRQNKVTESSTSKSVTYSEIGVITKVISEVLNDMQTSPTVKDDTRTTSQSQPVVSISQSQDIARMETMGITESAAKHRSSMPQHATDAEAMKVTESVTVVDYKLTSSSGEIENGVIKVTTDVPSDPIVTSSMPRTISSRSTEVIQFETLEVTEVVTEEIDTNELVITTPTIKPTTSPTSMASEVVTEVANVKETSSVPENLSEAGARVRSDSTSSTSAHKAATDTHEVTTLLIDQPAVRHTKVVPDTETESQINDNITKEPMMRDTSVISEFATESEMADTDFMLKETTTSSTLTSTTKEDNEAITEVLPKGEATSLPLTSKRAKISFHTTVDFRTTGLLYETTEVPPAGPRESTSDMTTNESDMTSAVTTSRTIDMTTNVFDMTTNVSDMTTNMSDMTSSFNTATTPDINTDITSPPSTDMTSDASTDMTSAVSTDMTSGGSTDMTSGASTDMTSGGSTDMTSAASTDMISSANTDMTSGANTDMTSGGSTDMTSGASTDMTSGGRTDMTSVASTDMTSGASTDISSANTDMTSGGSTDITYIASTDMPSGGSTDMTSIASTDLPSGGSTDMTYIASTDMTSGGSTDKTSGIYYVPTLVFDMTTDVPHVTNSISGETESPKVTDGPDGGHDPTEPSLHQDISKDTKSPPKVQTTSPPIGEHISWRITVQWKSSGWDSPLKWDNFNNH